MMVRKGNENLTYAKYLTMDEDARVEVIDGKIYNMYPAPSPMHQSVQAELLTEFNLYCRDKKCKVFPAPIDVCFSNVEIDKLKEWVQPDLVIVCDKSKIRDKRIVGVPDLIVEILSGATARKDKTVKYNLYQKVGVKEYWIVDPSNEFIDVYLLEDDRYEASGTYFKDDSIPVNIFDGFSIDLKNVFREDGN